MFFCQEMLDVSVLNTSYKFRGQDNKEGAVAELETAGLKVVKEERATRGTTKVVSELVDQRLATINIQGTHNCHQCMPTFIWPASYHT